MDRIEEIKEELLKVTKVMSKLLPEVETMVKENKKLKERIKLLENKK